MLLVYLELAVLEPDLGEYTSRAICALTSHDVVCRRILFAHFFVLKSCYFGGLANPEARIPRFGRGLWRAAAFFDLP